MGEEKMKKILYCNACALYMIEGHRYFDVKWANLLSKFADVTLLSGANEGPLQGGSTSAEISQLFLVDLIYTEYYRRYFDKCSQNNERTSASVLEKLC